MNSKTKIFNFYEWKATIAEIRLTPEDREECVRLARLQRSASAGFNNQKVSTRSYMDIEVTGQTGQMAFARWAGVPYEGNEGSFRNADFPQFNVEVRTRTLGWHDLKVSPGDDDSRRVVLAIDFGPKWYVRLWGWMLAKDAKRYPLIDPRGAALPFHAVPSDDLLSMPSLRKLIGL